MLISTLIIIGLLISFKFLIKDQERKNKILKICAIATIAIHYSSLYVDFFSGKDAIVDNTMLLPVYPCNVIMWLLLIVAFFKNKESKIYKVIAETTFYIGIVGGVIGIMFNEIYFNNPDMSDWSVLKGLLSHSTMLIGCIYLLVGNFIKIRVSNVLSVVIGLLGLLVDGLIVIGLFKLFNMSPPNVMYLLEPPVEGVKWINTWTIGLLGVIVAFAITATYEQIFVDKEKRWYKNLIQREENKDERDISKDFWRR